MRIKAAYLIPHAPVFIREIGEGQTEHVQKTRHALEQIRLDIQDLMPDTIVIISPHGPIFSDAIAIYDFPEYKGNLSAYGAFNLNYTFPKDDEFINSLVEISRENDGYYYPLSEEEFRAFQYEPELDHGIIVPLHFVYPQNKNTKIVAMSYGTLSYLELLKQGSHIYNTAEKLNRTIVVIASGDMSHALKTSGPYEMNQKGLWFDVQMQTYIKANEPYRIFIENDNEIEEAKECGLRSFAVMMGAMRHYTLHSEILSYEGPFGVGYLTARFQVEGKRLDNPIHEVESAMIYKINQINESAHPFAIFARKVIEHYVRTKSYPKVSNRGSELIFNDEILLDHLSEDQIATLSARNGVFVSVKYNGVLRGCIGSIYSSEDTVCEEIIRNAVMAASEDQRFEPISKNELDLITVSVDVLSVPEIIHSINALSPERLGVIVYKGEAYGVLLPNLEGIETVEDQLIIASNKAGFHVDEIEKIACFTVDRYK